MSEKYDSVLVKNQLAELSMISNGKFVYTTDINTNIALLKKYLIESEFFNYAKGDKPTISFNELKQKLEKYEETEGKIPDVDLAVNLYEYIVLNK